MGSSAQEWHSLLAETQDLVAQDNYNFPKVDRNIQQLQQYAETLRSRTSKLRSLNNQVAATRLLAQQGFDASRLTEEVTALEIQPTIEDVFHADTSSVEEYLRQVEESTILAALQEAEQQTVAAFDAHMEDCMARDWATNKRQLYGLIAPHSGAAVAGGAGAAGSWQGQGAGPPARGAQQPATGPAGPRTAVSLPASEQAYVEVITRYQAALRTGATFDLVTEFRQAAKGGEAGVGGETTMRSCWALLADMLAEARTRGVVSTSGSAYLEALASGARKHLERGHCQHMRNTVVRHKLRAERGADPEPLREVQAYIQVKLGGGSRGPLDFQAAGGTDTSWMQVFFCLRNGWHDAARRAAERAHDVVLSRLGDGGIRAVLDEWLRTGGRLPERTCLQLARACETLLHDKAALKSQVRQAYLVLVLALLAGDSRAVDALVSTLSALQLPSVLSTIEDFMWTKLTLLHAGPAGRSGLDGSSPLLPAPTLPGLSGSLLSGGPGGGAGLLPPYGLSDLATDINRWPASYYSKQGKEPLLYLTVLMLSLQFPQALRFLWQDDMARGYRADAVHLAIALQQEGILAAASASGGDAGPDVSAMIHAYGRKFVHGDSSLALQYYMLAAQAAGNTLAVKGQLLRELLTESRDFGTLLGGGSGPGGGALGAYVTDPEERKRLFEAVAYECQVAAQPEEAVELYLAAGRPRQALALLTQQVAAVMPAALEEATTGNTASGAGEALKRLMMRSADARGRVGPQPDLGTRKEVEASLTLVTAWDLLLAARKGHYAVALQKLSELGCIPLEASRVDLCSRAAQTSLHLSVQERLPEMLAAAADTLAAQKAGATRDKVYALRLQLDALCQFASSISFRVPRSVYQKLSETAAAFA